MSKLVFQYILYSSVQLTLCILSLKLGSTFETFICVSKNEAHFSLSIVSVSLSEQVVSASLSGNPGFLINFSGREIRLGRRGRNDA